MANPLSIISGNATAIMGLSLLQAADTCARWNKLEVTGGQFVSADGMIVSAYITAVVCGRAVRIHGENAIKLFCSIASACPVRVRLQPLVAAPSGEPLVSIEGTRGLAALMQDQAMPRAK